MTTKVPEKLLIEGYNVLVVFLDFTHKTQRLRCVLPYTSLLPFSFREKISGKDVYLI
jgi:hypothetical protein